jgi:hypothetical protein
VKEGGRQNKNLAQIILVLPGNKENHMGVDMKDKKKVCEKIVRRYQKANKKGRGKLLAPMLRLMRDFLTTEYSLPPVGH